MTFTIPVVLSLKVAPQMMSPEVELKLRVWPLT